PTSILARLRSVVHRLPRIRERDGQFIPDRYGCWASIRELGSEPATQYYFQDLDVLRYIQVVEQTIFRGVGDFLSDRGYSIADVLDVAKDTINSVTINGGNFSNTAIGIGRIRQTGGTDRPQGDERRDNGATTAGSRS
ncbi:hypothetical protein SAMN05660350_02452, partial [Geodermatophilus obscurus]